MAAAKHEKELLNKNNTLFIQKCQYIHSLSFLILLQKIIKYAIIINVFSVYSL